MEKNPSMTIQIVALQGYSKVDMWDAIESWHRRIKHRYLVDVWKSLLNACEVYADTCGISVELSMINDLIDFVNDFNIQQFGWCPRTGEIIIYFIPFRHKFPTKYTFL